MGPNCLQKLAADDTRRQKSEEMHVNVRTIYFVFVSESNEGSDHTAQVSYLIHVYVLKSHTYIVNGFIISYLINLKCQS